MLVTSLRATRPASVVIKKSLHPAASRASSRIVFARATTSNASPTMVASSAVNEVRLHQRSTPPCCFLAFCLVSWIAGTRPAGAETGAGSCVLTASPDTGGNTGASGYCGLEATSATAPDKLHPPGSALTSCSSCNLAQTYEALAKKLKEVSALAGVQGLLGWDEMVGASKRQSCVSIMSSGHEGYCFRKGMKATKHLLAARMPPCLTLSLPPLSKSTDPMHCTHLPIAPQAKSAT